MIKLTRILSLADNAPKLFIIPGGPGLSSLTLRDLDLLKRNFELVYVDMQGTNGTEYQNKRTFAELSSVLAEAIKKESGPKYALGHSFGGFFASELLLREVVSGLICLSTPFSEVSLLAANENYEANKASGLAEAEFVWEHKQDDASFAKWLSEYGVLYFKSSKGKELVSTDKVSSQFFKDNRADVLDKEVMLESLLKIEGVKIFIAGQDDKLLPMNVLKNDSQRGGFQFFTVEDASHFVTVDQPEKVAGLIESQLLRS